MERIILVSVHPIDPSGIYWVTDQGAAPMPPIGCVSVHVSECRYTCFLCYCVFFGVLMLLVGRQKEHQAHKIEQWAPGMVICLEPGANDLHMVKLIPLLHHHLCFRKTLNGLSFWYRFTQVVLEKRSVRWVLYVQWKRTAGSWSRWRSLRCSVETTSTCARSVFTTLRPTVQWLISGCRTSSRSTSNDSPGLFAHCST